MSEASSIVTLVFVFLACYFEVFLLLSFLERQVSKRKTPIRVALSGDALPKVCIVVPCFNEEKTVALSIQSLLALSYPREKLEIMVIDDGSRDRTYEIALGFTNDERVTVLQKENGGKHTALNLALSRTDAEFIGCLDADSMVDGKALVRIINAFGADKKIAAVTPGINVRAPRTILQHIQHVEYLLGIFNRYVFAGLGSVFITPGPFSVFRASVVREIGGWRHGHSTEDMELGLRLQSAGWRIANEPLAAVRTATPATLRALVKQRVRWSYGFIKNIFDYRHMVGNPKYGTLGILILPTAITSFAAVLYFAVQISWSFAISTIETISRIALTGLSAPSVPDFLFFFNTNVLWLIVYTMMILTTILISLGSFLSSGRRYPPAATPVFLALYGFIVPLWLGIALVRAAFNRGVQWR